MIPIVFTDQLVLYNFQNIQIIENLMPAAHLKAHSLSIKETLLCKVIVSDWLLTDEGDMTCFKEHPQKALSF